MARTLLLLLFDEPDSRRRHGPAHFLSLVAHDHENPFGRRQLQGGVHHVFHQRLAARAVQHLGLPRFHAGSESCRQNDHCKGNLH